MSAWPMAASPTGTVVANTPIPPPPPLGGCGGVALMELGAAVGPGEERFNGTGSVVAAQGKRACDNQVRLTE